MTLKEPHKSRGPNLDPAQYYYSLTNINMFFINHVSSKHAMIPRRIFYFLNIADVIGFKQN